MLAPLLGVACAATAGEAMKVSPGQELLYSGTVEEKFASADGPDATLKSRLTASAVVRADDPGPGPQVILMQSFAREAIVGRPALPPDAHLSILGDVSAPTESPGPTLVVGPPFGIAIEVPERPEVRRKE